MTFQNTLAFAQQLDAQDTLAKYRDEFHFPQVNGKDVIPWDCSPNAPKSLWMK
jgi:kynureninase